MTMMTMNEKMELARKCVEEAKSASFMTAREAVAQALNIMTNDNFIDVANRVYNYSDADIESVHIYDMYELDDVLSGWTATEILEEADNIRTWDSYFSLTEGNSIETADDPRELSEIDVMFIADLAAAGNQDFSSYDIRCALDSVVTKSKRYALRKYIDSIDMKEYALLTGSECEKVYKMEELDTVAYTNRWSVSDVFKMTLNEKGFDIEHDYFFTREDVCGCLIASISGKDDYFPTNDFIENALDCRFYIEDEAIRFMLHDDNWAE